MELHMLKSKFMVCELYVNKCIIENTMFVCGICHSLSHVWLFVTAQTVAH